MAAILGIILISYVLTNKNTPKGVAFTHGPIAAIGIILLIIYAFFHHPSPLISITLFILAAFGGFLIIEILLENLFQNGWQFYTVSQRLQGLFFYGVNNYALG